VIDNWNGNIGVFSEVLHRRYFGFSLKSGHESTSYARDQLVLVCKCDKVGLSGYENRIKVKG